MRLRSHRVDITSQNICIWDGLLPYLSQNTSPPFKNLCGLFWLQTCHGVCSDCAVVSTPSLVPVYSTWRSYVGLVRQEKQKKREEFERKNPFQPKPGQTVMVASMNRKGQVICSARHYTCIYHDQIFHPRMSQFRPRTRDCRYPFKNLIVP